MVRGDLMIRGALIFRRVTNDDWLSLGPLLVTGVVFFLVGPDDQRGPDCSDVLFVGFRTDFVTSVRVSVASAGVLALEGLRPAGARKPQWGAPSPPPWLRSWMASFVSIAPAVQKSFKENSTGRFPSPLLPEGGRLCEESTGILGQTFARNVKQYEALDGDNLRQRVTGHLARAVACRLARAAQLPFDIVRSPKKELHLLSRTEPIRCRYIIHRKLNCRDAITPLFSRPL